jgi:hypothetical protein
VEHNRPELQQQNENENLAWGPGLGAQGAFDLWFAEKQNYSYDAPRLCFNADPPPVGDGCPVNGHYTQLLWKATTKVGCASNSQACPDGKTHWSCRYQPPGNFNAHVPDVDQATAVASLNANVLNPATCHGGFARPQQTRPTPVQRPPGQPCQAGLVHRDSFEGDTACVRPDERYRLANGSCRSGYVWRERFEGDTVCVLPPERDANRRRRGLPVR